MREPQRPGTSRPYFKFSALALAMQLTDPALAQSPPPVVQREALAIRMSAQPLGQALTELANQSGLLIGVDASLVRGKRAPALRGRYTPEQALRILLAGTGLTYRFTGPATVTLERLVSQGENGGPIELGAITVGGAEYASLYEVDDGFKAEFQTSATKSPLSIRETPQSISVITQDSIKARQVQDLRQALEMSAGVNKFTGPGPFGGRTVNATDQVQIRGVTLDDSLDIREDGFVSPAFHFQPDLAVYERIEVVKGPSSTLYGRGSAGGFINYVRKKPLPEFHAEITPSIGSFDFYRAEGDVTGPLFESEAARGRFIAAYEDAGSFVDGVESDRVMVAPSFEADLTDSTRLLIQGLYQKDEFIPNAGFPLRQEGNNFRAPDVRRSLFFGVPSDDESEFEALTGSLQLDQDLSRNWLATLRLNRSDQDRSAVSDNYAYGLDEAGNTSLYSSASEFDTDVLAGEFRLQGSLDVLRRPATVVLGLDYTDLQSTSIQASALLGTANIYEENFADVAAMDPVQVSDTLIEQQNTGGYAQFQVRPLERLSVLFGGRYDQAETSTENHDADTRDEQDDHEFTGRVGLVIDVRDQISMYGLYAQSFSPVSNVAADGSILDPQTGEIYEAGIKTEWLDGKLGINAAVFRIERDDVPIPDPDNGPGEFFSISGGVQRSDGFELEINGEPLPGWNLSFAGTLLDSEFVERDDPLFGTMPGGAADWQLGLFSSYELQRGPLQGLGLGAGLFAIDDRGVSSFTGGTVPGYERVDLSAFYNGFKPLEIALQVRNVLDETYVEGTERPAGYAFFGAPTAVLLTVRYAFGD